jgi:hypothetical protein
MSTTIDIIPVETCEITYGQIIGVGERNINKFLASLGIDTRVTLNVNLHDNNEKYVNQINLNDKFDLKENEYAWFYISGVPGGTDAYQRQIEDKEINFDNPWWWLDDIKLNNKTVSEIKNKLEKAKKINKSWYFRRSAGQRGIIALSYGLISAAVAELTSGILCADDGAWDHERFPAESQEFLQWYFQPDKALKEENGEWAKRCLEGISEDLENYSAQQDL